MGGAKKFAKRKTTTKRNTSKIPQKKFQHKQMAKKNCAS
jgi:hypothetical protein